VTKVDSTKQYAKVSKETYKEPYKDIYQRVTKIDSTKHLHVAHVP
jgi:hypothetical protein